MTDILSEGISVTHTWFQPAKKSTSGVKKWIAYSDGFAKGRVVINKGAADALKSVNAVSLLPVGVVTVESEFKRGDLIRIVDEEGNSVGLGKAQYGSDRVETEKKSEKQKALVHYDYLYMEK